ncbi:MAG TPA: hypothetical protein VMI93_12225 [Candidatus Solibacter sp.]|nr:hypothetical protein [Candidatus Solibacter sp.]
MNPVEGRRLQRVRYWAGQMLRAWDFREQASDVAQHRWWHNRALHDAYGVYEGLEVSSVFSGGRLTAVIAEPGVAYDCFGRELIVQKRRTIQLPANPVPRPEFSKTEFVLLLQYAAEETCACGQDIKDVCWPARGSSLVEGIFQWKLRESVKLEDGVPLGLIQYVGARGPALEPQFVPRPVRGLTMPLIGHGASLPQSTIWEPWLALPPENAAPGSRVIGLQTKVDTSGAGFTETPDYFAWIAGETIPIIFPNVTNETSQGFAFQISLLALESRRGEFIFSGMFESTAPRALNTVLNSTLAERLKFSVEWIGCQMPPRRQRRSPQKVPVLGKRTGPI